MEGFNNYISHQLGCFEIPMNQCQAIIVWHHFSAFYHNIGHHNSKLAHLDLL